MNVGVGGVRMERNKGWYLKRGWRNSGVGGWKGGGYGRDELGKLNVKV